MSRKMIITCDGCGTADETHIYNTTSYPDGWARVSISVAMINAGTGADRTCPSRDNDLCPSCMADLPQRVDAKTWPRCI